MFYHPSPQTDYLSVSFISCNCRHNKCQFWFSEFSQTLWPNSFSRESAGLQLEQWHRLVLSTHSVILDKQPTKNLHLKEFKDIWGSPQHLIRHPTIPSLGQQLLSILSCLTFWQNIFFETQCSSPRPLRISPFFLRISKCFRSQGTCLLVQETSLPINRAGHSFSNLLLASTPLTSRCLGWPGTFWQRCKLAAPKIHFWYYSLTNLIACKMKFRISYRAHNISLSMWQICVCLCMWRAAVLPPSWSLFLTFWNHKQLLLFLFHQSGLFLTWGAFLNKLYKLGTHDHLLSTFTHLTWVNVWQ